MSNSKRKQSSEHSIGGNSKITNWFTKQSKSEAQWDTDKQKSHFNVNEQGASSDSTEKCREEKTVASPAIN